jgi:hypothetical protein
MFLEIVSECWHRPKLDRRLKIALLATVAKRGHLIVGPASSNFQHEGSNTDGQLLFSLGRYTSVAKGISQLRCQPKEVASNRQGRVGMLDKATMTDLKMIGCAY